MIRLILLALLLVSMLMAFTAVTALVRAVTPSRRPGGKDSMPDTFKTIAYVVLVLLLIGISSGWLGAA